MRSLPLLVCALNLVVSFPVLGEDSAGAPEAPAALPTEMTAPDHPLVGVRLTLDECVAEALAKNFSVRIASFSTDQAKAQVVIAQSVYDPVLGVQWQAQVERSSQSVPEVEANGSAGITAVAVNPYTSNQASSLSATENLPTGGQVTAGYQMDRFLSTPASSFLNPAYTGTVSLTVSQPLLQGAGTDYMRAAIDSARQAERVAGLGFKSSVLTTIFNLETAYYNLAFNRRQYEVARDNLKLSEQLLDENRIKRETGVLTDLDVVQAEAGVANARSGVILYRQDMENAEDTLLQAMGEREFQRTVGTIVIPPAPDTAVSFDVSYKLARDNGPSLAQVQATIEEYKLEALRAKRSALPQLNLTGGAGRLTTQGAFSPAIDQTWNGTGYTWQAGLAFSMPWGLRQSRAQYRQAEDNVRSEEATLEQTDQNLMVQLRSAVRAVRSNQEAATSASEASRLSAKQYELQKAKFDAGLATSYDVLQAQYQLESARVSQVQAEVNLRTAVANLHFLEGTTLARYRIDLKA